MKCELLKVQQVIGETIMQSTISEILRVPENKPGVEQIVSVDGFVRIRRIEVIEDKIIVHGRLHVGVVYVGLLDSKPVHYTHERVEFTQFAEVPGCVPGMVARVDARILDLQGQCDSPHHHVAPDMYEIIALIEINARVTQVQEINVLVEPDPGVSAMTQRVRVEEIITTGQLQDIIQASFTVPDEKPAIERILDVGAEVFCVETKVIDGQVLIEADADLQVMYVALTGGGHDHGHGHGHGGEQCGGDQCGDHGEHPIYPDSQPVHHMHHRYHFTEFVPVPDLIAKYRLLRARDLRVSVQDLIEYLSFDTRGPDTIKVELVMSFNVIVTKTRDVDIVTAITDGTAPNYQVQTLTLEQVVGEAHTQTLVTDEIRVPENEPGAHQLLDLKIIRIHVPREEIVLLNDKVVMGGVVHLKAIYVAMLDSQPVHAVEAWVKFRSFIAIPGALPDMVGYVTAILEHATGHVQAPDSIKVELVLQLIGRVVVVSQIDTVLCPAAPMPAPAPSPTPTAPCPPGFPPGAIRTTVTIQPGDTVFQYAIQYHVSMGRIIAANPGVDPNNLVVGSTLNIPCDP
jgi:LysM repeat protein